MDSVTNKLDKKVAIIGGGIVGISTAIFLLRRGCEVTIFDKKILDKPASFGNAGWLSSTSIVPVLTPGILSKLPKMIFSKYGPLFLRFPGWISMIPWLLKYLSFSSKEKVNYIAENLKPLTIDTVAMHKKLSLNTQASRWIKESSFFYIYKNKIDYENDYSWTVRKNFGYQWKEVQSEELQNTYPDLDKDYKFGIRLDNMGYISNSMQYLSDLVDEVKKLGGSIIEEEVIDIEEVENKIHVVTKNLKNYQFDRCAITCGVFSNNLAQKFGSTVAVQSERGYHVEFEEPNINLKFPIMNAFMKFGITPMQTGLRFAGLVEFGSLNSEPSEKAFNKIISNAHEMFPALTYSNIKKWSGHRPATADSLPVIGQSPSSENVYFGYGHQHIGLTTGPKTGELLSKSILQDNDIIPLNSYKADRF
ncbi:MAG: FAD-binding oxidoreductase [Candidatus Pelagibacter sp.]|nr:FAD-binding oxidoreductase [Candidatus Pelagibacter sp.]